MGNQNRNRYGKVDEKATRDNARAIALRALLLITDEREYLNDVIGMALEKYAYLDKKDRGFITKLVHGTVEYLYQIDAIIDRYSSVKVKKQKPLVRGILRLSVYQIMHMDRVPDFAACDEAVILSKLFGLDVFKGFINGVLRNIVKTKESLVFTEMDIRYSMPKWIIDIFAKEMYEESLHKNLAACLEERPLSIRVNLSKISTQDLMKEIEEMGISVTRSAVNADVLLLNGYDAITDLTFLAEKKAYIQDASGSLVCKLADFSPKSIVMDVCASPGGKTLHALDILAGSGYVHAFDVSDQKIARLKENIDGFGYANYSLKVADAREFLPSFAGLCDVVIADVPCSGLGVLGGKPDIKLNMSKEACAELAKIGLEILNNVCRYVKIGGVLMFSTCTIHKQENEDNLRKFLQMHTDFELVDLREHDFFKESLIRPKKEFLQLYPSDGCDGFFIGKLRRTH